MVKHNIKVKKGKGTIPDDFPIGLANLTEIDKKQGHPVSKETLFVTPGPNDEIRVIILDPYKENPSACVFKSGQTVKLKGIISVSKNGGEFKEEKGMYLNHDIFWATITRDDDQNINGYEEIGGGLEQEYVIEGEDGVAVEINALIIKKGQKEKGFLGAGGFKHIFSGREYDNVIVSIGTKATIRIIRPPDEEKRSIPLSSFIQYEEFEDGLKAEITSSYGDEYRVKWRIILYRKVILETKGDKLFWYRVKEAIDKSGWQYDPDKPQDVLSLRIDALLEDKQTGEEYSNKDSLVLVIDDHKFFNEIKGLDEDAVIGVKCFMGTAVIGITENKQEQNDLIVSLTRGEKIEFKAGLPTSSEPPLQAEIEGSVISWFVYRENDGKINILGQIGEGEAIKYIFTEGLISNYGNEFGVMVALRHPEQKRYLDIFGNYTNRLDDALKGKMKISLSRKIKVNILQPERGVDKREITVNNWQTVVFKADTTENELEWNIFKVEGNVKVATNNSETHRANEEVIYDMDLDSGTYLISARPVGQAIGAEIDLSDEVMVHVVEAPKIKIIEPEKGQEYIVGDIIKKEDIKAKLDVKYKEDFEVEKELHNTESNDSIPIVDGTTMISGFDEIRCRVQDKIGGRELANDTVTIKIKEPEIKIIIKNKKKTGGEWLSSNVRLKAEIIGNGIFGNSIGRVLGPIDDKKKIDALVEQNERDKGKKYFVDWSFVDENGESIYTDPETRQNVRVAQGINPINIDISKIRSVRWGAPTRGEDIPPEEDVFLKAELFTKDDGNNKVSLGEDKVPVKLVWLRIKGKEQRNAKIGEDVEFDVEGIDTDLPEEYRDRMTIVPEMRVIQDGE